MIEIRNFRPEEWRLYRGLRLSALRDSPDAFGSTFEQAMTFEDGVWESRLENIDPMVNCPVGAFEHRRAVGLAWGVIAAENRTSADLYQMWTSPECRGQGVGRRLMDTVTQWAHVQGASEIVLGVTLGNIAAETLYRSAGFEAFGDPEPLRPGVDKWVTNMKLVLTRA